MRLILRGAALVVAAVGIAVVGPAAVAEASPSHPLAHGGHSSCVDSRSETQQDRDFLKAAHQSNLAEIAAGKLALQKSQNKDVRDLGAMWITDHTRLDAGLVATAEYLGVTLPSTPNAEQRALAAKLSKLSGPAFDKVWIDGNTTGHKKAKATGEKELKKGSNCKALTVDKTSAPVVAHHLMELLALRSEYTEK